MSIEAANERAPRWAGDFTLECYERSEELPLLAHDVLEIVRQCRPSGENSLAKIWEPRIVSKIERVASEAFHSSCALAWHSFLSFVHDRHAALDASLILYGPRGVVLLTTILKALFVCCVVCEFDVKHAKIQLN